MIFAANYSANHNVLPRFGRSRQNEFLLARLKQQIPSLHLASILGPQQGEAVDRSIPVPRLAPASRHSQKYLLASLDGDLRSALPSDLITAVAVGQQLDDMSLRRSCLGARATQPCQKEACRRDYPKTTTKPG